MKNLTSKFKTMFNSVSTEMTSQKSVMEKKNVIKRHQKEIIEKYQVIGEKVYAFYTEGLDVGEKFQEECSDINEIMNNINKIQEEIDMVLKEKEETIRKNKEKLEELKVQATPPMNNNVNGEVVEVSHEAVKEKETVEVDEKSIELLEAGEEKTQENDVMFCPKCGNKMSSDANFCVKCGNKIN